MARSSAVRINGEFDGLRGDVDLRCGDERINYISTGGEDGQGGVAKDVEVAAVVAAAEVDGACVTGT